MGELALLGGKPVRTLPFPSWPQGGLEESLWLEKVIKSRHWFAGLQGDEPEALGTLFGERFARLHEVRHALPVANGSAAIEIALRALGIRPGDEVIVPAYTFISTATSVLVVGAIPIFADMEPSSYCLDPKDVARRITPRTRAIIPVHLGGHMTDMPSLMEIAEKKRIPVIEDCAQAIDSSLEEKKAGKWGALGTFSFQSNKTITSGEGGLITANDPALAERVVALRAFGRFRTGKGVRSSDLTCQQVSSNYRLSEFQSAVLLAQLEKFPKQDARRQASAHRLTERLREIPGITHVLKQGVRMKHGYYYYLVRYDPAFFADAQPERLCEALNAEGIPFVPGDRKALYRHPVFQAENLAGVLSPEVLNHYRQAANVDNPDCPETEKACACTLILRHQVLLGEDKDMDDIVEALWKVQRNGHGL
jgi:dTDP-4-amino-4,6-dideoxygalactose transaminase